MANIVQGGFESGLFFDDVTVYGIPVVNDVIVNNATHFDWSFDEVSQVMQNI